MQTVIFTIFCKNYLAHARVLMNSVRRWNPAARRVGVLVDRADGYFNPSGEDFDIVSSEELPIPASRLFHLKYSLVELCTAVKPYAMEFLLERERAQNIVYFDPDIELYDSLDSLLARLGSHSFLLTPHLTRPMREQGRPSELDILKSGAFNLGFLALRDCAESREMLAWWRGHVYDHCRIDFSNGLFVDQRWLDLAPGMFPGLGIVRDAGCNAAYWNLHERSIVHKDGRVFANGDPLVFFHFSGFDPENPSPVSRFQDRFELSDLDAHLRELFLNYAEELRKCGFQQCRRWPWAYRAFANGIPIPDPGRRLIAGAGLSSSEDPFSKRASQFYTRFWNAPAENGLPQLAWAIYESREDLRQAFPEPNGRDRAALLRWLLTFGTIEYNLHEVFCAPLRREWEAAVQRLPNRVARWQERGWLWACQVRLKLGRKKAAA